MKQGFCFIILSVCLLTACNRPRQYQDLQNYIDQLKQQFSVKQKPPSSKPIYQVVKLEYKKNSERSPFDELVIVQSSVSSNPLTGYAINVLRFVGTITENDKIWAYIMTPDNKIYRIAIGDKIGVDGVVTRIDAKQVDITEQTVTDEAQDTPRVITLQLKEEG